MISTTRFLLGGLAVALLLAPGARAATDDSLQGKYEEKLAKEFVEYGGWMTDYDAARAAAKEQGKVLFVYFSRSYAP